MLSINGLGCVVLFNNNATKNILHSKGFYSKHWPSPYAINDFWARASTILLFNPRSFAFHCYPLFVASSFFLFFRYVRNFSFVTFSNDPCPVILETMRFVEYISNHRLKKRVDRKWNWILVIFILTLAAVILANGKTFSEFSAQIWLEGSWKI